jgi:hypothetical protein
MEQKNDEIKNEEKKFRADQLKKIDSYIEEYRADRELGSYAEKDGEGCIFIDLTEDPIYKEYSGKALLNNDIYDFIEDAYSMAGNKSGLTLSFRFPSDMTSAEKDKILKLYRTHYAVRFKALRSKMKKQRIVSMILLFIGVVILATDIAIKVNNNNTILTEVIDIMAWVFIWQAGDIFFFGNFDDTKLANEYLRLFTAKLQEDEQEE